MNRGSGLVARFSDSRTEHRSMVALTSFALLVTGTRALCGAMSCRPCCTINQTWSRVTNKTPDGVTVYSGDAGGELSGVGSRDVPRQKCSVHESLFATDSAKWMAAPKDAQYI